MRMISARGRNAGRIGTAMGATIARGENETENERLRCRIESVACGLLTPQVPHANNVRSPKSSRPETSGALIADGRVGGSAGPCTPPTVAPTDRTSCHLFRPTNPFVFDARRRRRCHRRRIRHFPRGALRDASRGRPWPVARARRCACERERWPRRSVAGGFLK